MCNLNPRTGSSSAASTRFRRQTLGMAPPWLPCTFPFTLVPAYLRLSRLFGVTLLTSNVRVTGSEMIAMFGPRRIRTALANIEHVEVTGPYHFIKSAGPARLSFVMG